MIREARETDLDYIVDAAKRFHALTPLAEYVTPSGESLVSTARQLMASTNSLLLVEDNHKGMSGGVLFSLFYDLSVTLGQELFWWSETPGVGRALHGEMERWAKSKGCMFWNMICLETSEPERVAKVYERRGYAPLERTFMKVL